MRRPILSLCLLVFSTTIVAAQQHDLLLEGGRVMDPEWAWMPCATSASGTIVRVSSEAVSGRDVVDPRRTARACKASASKALDDVTTALKLEIGVSGIAEFLKAKGGRSLIHYGASASHAAARAQVFGASLQADSSERMNRRFNNLVYGSYAPGAPDVFIDDAQWKNMWLGVDRCYVVASDYAVPRFEKLVGKGALNVLAASGGKVVLSNRPM